MPFTPFHFGPAALIKGGVPRYFSFMVFCFTQVVIDIEVLVQMARGAAQLHIYLHTYIGATGAAVVSFLVGRPLCQRFLRWWCSQSNVPLKEYYNPSPDIGVVAGLTGAFLGAYSHVFLDSMMHADIRPFFPFSDANPAFGLIGPGMLHQICFILGVLGIWICARVPSAKL